MPRIGSRSLVWAFAVFTGLLVFLGQGQEARASLLSYRALWEANENDDGRLIQIYDHLLCFELVQDLTNRLVSYENVRYNNRWEQEGAERETVSPGASLSVNGDLFVASLAVNSLKNLNAKSGQANYDSLDISWTSSWKKEFVPALRASFDTTRQRIDLVDNAAENNRQSVGGEVDWDLLVGKVFYSFKRDTGKNANNETASDVHLAKISAERSWLANKLRVALGHEYSQTRNENHITFYASTTAQLPVTLFEVLGADVDSSPTDPDLPGDPVYTSITNAIQDSDLITPVYSVLTNDSKNYAIRLNVNEQIDRIYLYTDSDLGALRPLGVNIAVYSNDTPDSSVWRDEHVTYTTYERTKKRFVIDLPALSRRYLKLVVYLSPGGVVPPIVFTELQAVRILNGIDGTTVSLMNKESKNKTNVSFNYNISKKAGVFYNFLADNTDFNGFTNNENESHNGGLRLQNTAGNMKSILSFSLTKNHYRTNPEMQTKMYQINVNKVFLPTLATAVGASHEESSQGGDSLYDRNRYTFYADAALYPDLSSRLDVTYWKQKNYNSYSGNSLSDSLRSQFTLTSRFRPSLTVNFFDTFEQQDQDSQLSKQTNTGGFSGNWQLSDWLRLGAVIQMVDSKFEHDAYLYSLDMVFGLGVSLELKANYSMQVSEITSQSGSSTLRWGVSRNVSWEAGCNYVKAEDEAMAEANALKVYSKVIVNFATN